MSALAWRSETIICSKNVLSSRAFCLINGDFVFDGCTFFKGCNFLSLFFFSLYGRVSAYGPLLFMLQLASSGFSCALENTLSFLLDSRYNLPVLGHSWLFHWTALVAGFHCTLLNLNNFLILSPFPSLFLICRDIK